MANTLEATKANLKRMENQKERRKNKVLKFITNNQGETAYSISKKINMPRSTLLDILDELIEDLQIKYIEITESNRKKKTIHTRTIDDFTHDRFNMISINIPLIKKLIENARRQEITITFDMPDGSVKELLPSQNLEKFIEENNY